MAQQNDDLDLDWGDIPRRKNSSPQPTYRKEGIENLKQFGEALGGGATGLIQGGSDLGANIAQFPSDVYSYFTGKEGYHAPKPDIRNMAPSSEIGQNFEKGGEIAAPFALSPTLAAESSLGSTMYGGRMLPRLLTDILGGAAEGETGDRKTSALLGAAAPALGKAKHWLTSVPKTQAGANRLFDKVRTEAQKQGELGIPLSFDFLRNLEYQLGSKHLKANKMQINNLLGNAAKGDYESYHELQSALGGIARELKHSEKEKASGIMGMIFNNGPKSTASERLTGNQVEDLRQQYISRALEHMNKTGKGKLANLEQKARTGYREYKQSVPLRNKAILGLSVGLPGYEYLKHFLVK